MMPVWPLTTQFKFWYTFCYRKVVCTFIQVYASPLNSSATLQYTITVLLARHLMERSWHGTPSKAHLLIGPRAEFRVDAPPQSHHLSSCAVRTE